MVFRFSSQHLLLLACLAVGCGPEFQASFSPLSEAGAPAEDNGPSGNTNASGQSWAGGGAGAQAGGAADVGGTANTSNAAGAANVAGANAGANNTGSGGACARRCDALEPWAERSYTLGERVSSICKAPYNGACAANTQHEFECQPPTGVVGLGWCSVRQPGVGNGWHEAWRISAACD